MYRVSVSRFSTFDSELTNKQVEASFFDRCGDDSVDSEEFRAISQREGSINLVICFESPVVVLVSGQTGSLPKRIAAEGWCKACGIPRLAWLLETYPDCVPDCVKENESNPNSKEHQVYPLPDYLKSWIPGFLNDDKKTANESIWILDNQCESWLIRVNDLNGSNRRIDDSN